MKKNKLLAGLLSLAMVSSMIPTTIAATSYPYGSAGGEGTDYLYYEDFSNSAAYDTDWDTPVVTKNVDGTLVEDPDNQRWSNKVEDGVMKYIIDTDVANSGGWNISIGGVNRYPFYNKSFGTNIPITRATTYEVGYSLDMKAAEAGTSTQFGTEDGTMKLTISADGGSYSFGQLDIYNHGSQGGQIAFSNQWLDHNDLIDGFIDFKIRFNLSKASYTIIASYTKTDGTPVTKEYTGAISVVAEESQTATGYISSLTGFKDATNDTNTIDGAYFMLDDIYVREVAAAIPVKYDTGNTGIVVADGEAEEGTIKDLPTIEEDNVAFGGWYFDADFTEAYEDGKATADRAVDGVITLYAKLTVSYTVNFYLAVGEDVYATVTSSTDGTIELPDDPYDISKGGFAGWVTADGEAFDAENVTDNVDVYASWNEYLYKEDFNDSSSYDTRFDVTVVDGEPQRWFNSIGDGVMTYTLDADVAQEGSNRNRTTVDFGTSVAGATLKLDGNTTYEAGYRVNMNGYAIKSEDYFLGWRIGGAAGGPSNDIAKMEADSGIPVIQSTWFRDADNTKWIDVKVKFNFNEAEYDANGTIDAGRYTTTVTYYKIGETEPTVYQFEEKSFYNQTNDTSEQNNAKTKIVKIFYGLKEASGSSLPDGANYSIDDVYVKVAEPTITVKYVVDNQEYVANEGLPEDSYADGGIVKNLAELPYLDDYALALDSWYYDAEFTMPYEPGNATSDKAVDGVITLYAKLLPIYTVTYYLAEGERYMSGTTTSDTIELPESPVNLTKGTFVGWVTADGAAFDGTGITGDMKVYATWNNYLYLENFNDSSSYDTRWDTPVVTKNVDGVLVEDPDNQRWSNKVENGYMSYIINTDVANLGGWNLAAGGVNRIPFSPDFGTTIELDQNTEYEAGYKIDFNGNKFSNEDDFMGINIGAGVVNNYLGTARVYNGILTVEGQTISDAVGYIDVKVIFNINGNEYTDNGTIDAGRYKVAISYMKDGATEPTVITTEEMSFNVQTTDTSEQSRSFVKYVRGIGYMKDSVDSSLVANGSSFKIDDIYVRVAQDEYATVTFDTMGGSEVASVEADWTGQVTLPEDPTKDGYVFAGWFTDTAYTQRFTPAGVNMDTTVYARWQTTPTVVSITPTDGATDTSTSPEITITFDSEMNTDAATKTNIKIMKGDVQLEEAMYNITVSAAADYDTIVKVTFNTALDYATEYTVVVKKEASNLAGEMAADVTSSFTTRKLKLDVTEAKVLLESLDGEEVTNIADAANKTVYVTFKVTGAEATVTPIATVFNETTMKNAAMGSNVTTVEDIESDMQVVEITIGDVAENDELSLMVWDISSTAILPATEKLTVLD